VFRLLEMEISGSSDIRFFTCPGVKLDINVLIPCI
jgi:hypothetical protein